MKDYSLVIDPFYPDWFLVQQGGFSPLIHLAGYSMEAGRPSEISRAITG